MSKRTIPRAFRPVVVNEHPTRTTLRKQCMKLLPPLTLSSLPERCPDSVFKAGRCREHFLDWKNARESRRGTEAVNPERRRLNALNLSGRQKRKHRKVERKAIR